MLSIMQEALKPCKLPADPFSCSHYCNSLSLEFFNCSTCKIKHLGYTTDLASVFVYKFKMQRQEMLLAYEWNPKERLLSALGVQNFYRDLKK